MEKNQEKADEILEKTLSITTSLITLSSACINGKVPLTVTFELIRKICFLYTDTERCQERIFLEKMRDLMKCKLRSVHTTLSKVVVEFDLEYYPIYQPDAKSFLVNTFPILKNDKNLYQLKISNGIYFDDLSDFSGFVEGNNELVDRSNINYSQTKCISAIYRAAANEIELYCHYELIDTNITCIVNYMRTGMLVQTIQPITIHKNCASHSETLSITGSVFYKNENDCQYRVICKNVLFETDYIAHEVIFHLNNVLSPPKKLFKSNSDDTAKKLNKVLEPSITLNPLTNFTNHNYVHYTISIVTLLLILIVTLYICNRLKKQKAQHRVLEQSHATFLSNM